MGWKDRAQPAGQGWKSRATQVEPPKDSGLLGKINAAINPYGMSIDPSREDKTQPVMGTPFDNPLFSLSNAPAKAAVGLASKALGPVAEMAATSRLPEDVAQLAKKYGAGDGIIRRVIGYSTPLTQGQQAIHDTAKLHQVGQGLLSKVLDSSAGLGKAAELGVQGLSAEELVRGLLNKK